MNDIYGYPYESPRPPAAPRRASHWWFPAASLVVIAGFIVLGFMLIWRLTNPEWKAHQDYLKRQAELKAESEAAAVRLARVELPTVYRDVVARAGPAVVNVANDVRSDRIPRSGRSEFHFSQQGEGSGVVIHREEEWTYVLTNAHVVFGADRIRLTFPSNLIVTVDKRNILPDPKHDLAVVRFKSSELPFPVVAEFAPDTEAPKRGDLVLAIGSPFGLEQTVTHGIVSAETRVDTGILQDVPLLQTDAAINPGNSGGPLLDLKGRIVGINTAILSRSGGSQGIGFAIPASVAKQVFAQLKDEPAPTPSNQGFLGVGLQRLPEHNAKELSIPGGVVVTNVLRNYPADTAGIKQWDVIVRFNSQPVTAVDQLQRLIQAVAPGTTVPVDIVRLDPANGGAPSRHTLQVKVGERP